MSPVHRGQLKRDEQGRENCTACGLCTFMPAEAITMKAEERKPDENMYREENMSIYEINMLRFFVVCVKRLVQKTLFTLTTSKVLVPSSYEREDFIFEKIN
jgi:NADH-quinone oxidoreductase subunit I